MVPSSAEVRSLTTKNLTKFSGNLATFAPADFESKVPAPADSELEAFFTGRAAQYEEPAKVRYSYAKITKDNISELVEVTPDMIAIYYSDNADLFRIRPGARLNNFRLILIQPMRKKNQRLNLL